MDEPRLLVGVNAGLDHLHTIIVREEESGSLRLMGEDRGRSAFKKGDSAHLVKRIQQSIDEAFRDAQVERENVLTVGIAVPGQVDIKHKTVLLAPNLNLRQVSLASLLEQKLHCPTFLINDVAARGIGEQRIGAGDKSNHMAYIYVSYGIGASLIINGGLYTGANNLAGEFGHTTVMLDGPICSCGKVGCLEAMSSRRAMSRELRNLYQRDHKTTVLEKKVDLEDPELDIKSALLAEAIDEEDALTISVVEKAGRTFGVGVANIINLLNPHTIILGGDVIDEVDLFFSRAVDSAREKSLTENMAGLSIIRGMLGTTAGAYGAAVFAKQRFEQARRGHGGLEA